MNTILIGLFALLGIFVGMIFFSYAGHRIALQQIKAHPNEKHPNNRIIEGALFALMGLLIAFTFSGARERFDIRRALVIDEANTIESVYLRFDLLPIDKQNAAKNNLRAYLHKRLAIYKELPRIENAFQNIQESQRMQQALWHSSVQGCQETGTSAACIVILPAVNHMIEIANTRIESLRIHPPAVILFTLIALALLSAALSGFNTSSKSEWLSLHIFVYSLIISFTIYIIINLEYPDRGFIHINYFNEVLVDLDHKLSAQ